MYSEKSHPLGDINPIEITHADGSPHHLGVTQVCVAEVPIEDNTLTNAAEKPDLVTTLEVAGLLVTQNVHIVSGAIHKVAGIKAPPLKKKMTYWVQKGAFPEGVYPDSDGQALRQQVLGL